MIYSLLLICAAGLAPQVLAQCSRETLQEITATYLEAQIAGDPSVMPLAADLTYVENNATMDVSEGVLAEAMTPDFDRSFYDTTQCASFTELTVAAGSHPYVIHTHLWVTDDEITSIDSIVSDAGDWVFNAAGYLEWTEQENWDPIPEAERDSREVIQAAGDAYLDQWGDTSVQVPFKTPCARLEGGIYTGQRSPATNSCRMPAFPQPLIVKNRRYVIDEEVGAVSIFNGFPWLDAGLKDGDAPSSNQVRVEGGLIRYIHEVTICSTRGCGRM